MLKILPFIHNKINIKLTTRTVMVKALFRHSLQEDIYHTLSKMVKQKSYTCVLSKRKFIVVIFLEISRQKIV